MTNTTKTTDPLTIAARWEAAADALVPALELWTVAVNGETDDGEDGSFTHLNACYRAANWNALYWTLTAQGLSYTEASTRAEQAWGDQ